MIAATFKVEWGRMSRLDKLYYQENQDSFSPGAEATIQSLPCRIHSECWLTGHFYPARTLHSMRRISVRALRFAWKYLLPPVVVACVAWYFLDRLRRPELWQGSLVFRVEWIVPACFVYLIAYTIWGRYYVTLLRNQGATVSSATGLRAYFISQIGKYVPGKLLVIVMRIAMLGKIGITRTAVGITAIYESIVWAGSGARSASCSCPNRCGTDCSTRFAIAAATRRTSIDIG